MSHADNILAILAEHERKTAIEAPHPGMDKHHQLIHTAIHLVDNANRTVANAHLAIARSQERRAERE